MEQAAIADLVGDAVLYRDLEPCDPALPRLAELRAGLGMASGPPPRKRDAAYAALMLALAERMQAARGGPSLAACAVIGDTENDRLLAHHLRAASPLPCYGFIGEDRPVAQEGMRWEGDTAHATRWHLARDWAAEVARRGGELSRAAILVDLDKTLLGPRGRSDGAIDDARAEAAVAVSNALLGGRLNVPAFRRTYAELCLPAWHPFTLDNQDYVVAAALLLATGAADLETLRVELAEGAAAFSAFLDDTATFVRPELAALHAELHARVAAGDPTPFKAFRRGEYRATLERMADGRLTLCGELFSLCQRLAQGGALLIAASDKPPESALPSSAQRAEGLLPLHHTPAVVD
jgi:hypothetical protein